MTNKLFVITGGPGTGKTATLEELKKRGYNTIEEAARKIATTDKRFIGKSIKEIKPRQFQEAIFEFQKKELSNPHGGENVFADRGIGDTLAYYIINHLEIPKEKLEYAKKMRYAGIFVLDFLNFYKTDELRKETKQEQENIQQEIIKMYKKLGYNPIIVPFDTIKKRADFILYNL